MIDRRIIFVAFVIGAMLTFGAAFDAERATQLTCLTTNPVSTSLDQLVVKGLNTPACMDAPPKIGTIVTVVGSSVDSRVRLPAGRPVQLVAADTHVYADRAEAKPNLRPPEKIAHFVFVIAAELLAAFMLLWPRPRAAGEAAWELLAPFLFFSNIGTFLNVAGWTHSPVIPVAFALRYSWLLVATAILARFALSVPSRFSDGVPSVITHVLAKTAFVMGLIGAAVIAVQYTVALLTGDLYPGAEFTAAYIAVSGLLALAALLSAAGDAGDEIRPQIVILTVAAFVGGAFAWPGQFSPTFVTGKLEIVQVAGTAIMIAGVVYLVWFAGWTKARSAAVPVMGMIAAGLVVTFDVAEKVLTGLLDPGGKVDKVDSLWLAFTVSSGLIPAVLKPIKDRFSAVGKQPDVNERLIAAIDRLETTLKNRP